MSMSRRLRFSLGSVALAAAAATCAPVAMAQSGGFNQLSPRQQEALAPLKDKWATLPPDSRQKWLEVANKMPSMSPPERERVQTRMGEWSRMSGEDRDRARSSFQEARQLPSEERQARWQAYQALPEEKRRELSQQARPAVPPPPRIGSDRPAARLDEQSGKSNIVGPGGGPGRPGATTTLPSAQANPPVHTQPGLPKIAASPGFVDRSTLLPQRGAQGAAVRKPPPAAAQQNNKPQKPNKGK